MLAVRNLQTGYGKSQILFDVSFDVQEGEVVCLLGRNGMGKTTTIRALMGLLRVWNGSITYEGEAIDNRPATQVARLGFGLVPEGRLIFPNLSVHENLLVAAANRRGSDRPWSAERVYKLFPSLQERRTWSGNLLSGGEQQMLAIGRALMTNPQVLILDEATEGLAPVIRDQIWDCIGTIRAAGQSIILIDKNLKRLVTFVDTFYVIEKGAVVWSGDAQRVRAEEETIKGFLSV